MPRNIHKTVDSRQAAQDRLGQNALAVAMLVGTTENEMSGPV